VADQLPGEAMTIFQKALFGDQVAEYLDHGHDRVSGYVLKAADAAALATPEDLYDAHGLGFDGSPWKRDAQHLDVIRFGGVPSDYVHDAVAPEFEDHPPFNGSGFAHSGDTVLPLYFLDEVRLPPGTEMWRVASGRPERLLAVYMDVATGWLAVEGDVPAQGPQRVPSMFNGWNAVWEGLRFLSDRKPGQDEVILASATQPEGIPGFGATPRGLWSRIVQAESVSDIYHLTGTCTWRDQPFHVVDASTDDHGVMLRLFYTGHKARDAERLGLNKSDAGVYWTVVNQQDVEDLRFLQARVPGFPDGSGPAR
jgi:hypothetical protein